MRKLIVIAIAVLVLGFLGPSQVKGQQSQETGQEKTQMMQMMENQEQMMQMMKDMNMKMDNMMNSCMGMMQMMQGSQGEKSGMMKYREGMMEKQENQKKMGQGNETEMSMGEQCNPMCRGMMEREMAVYPWKVAGGVIVGVLAIAALALLVVLEVFWIRLLAARLKKEKS